jgi:hypothetical protein
LQCSQCPLKNIGQTEHTFRIWYREHINAIRTNRKNSKFGQHILNTEYEYDTLEQTMKILHAEKKRPKLSTLERFYICDITKEGLQKNDTFTDIHSPIFDTLIKNAYIKKPPTPLSLTTVQTVFHPPFPHHHPQHRPPTPCHSI